MPKTIREQTIFPICVRELRVLRSVDVTPGMRRVTLGGPELEAFTTGGFSHPAFRSDGFDDDIRLVFPHPGETEPVLPLQKEGTVEFHTTPRPLMRAYTVRRWDAEKRELDIDFAKHGVGIATVWAYECQPGDRVHLVGPAHSAAWPEGVDRLLVVGDETALPAISRLLDELPEGLSAQVFVEVKDATHEQPLTSRTDVTITWLHRGSAPAGSTSLLLEAVVGAEWPPGDVYAWLAGEAVTLKPIRRFLVNERGLPKDRVEMTGYWRRKADSDDAEMEQPGIASPIDALFEQLHEMAELLPPYALRTAVTLGLPELISNGTTDVATLAENSGADPRALGKLLRYLGAVDVVRRTDDPAGYELTDLGHQLTDDFIVQALDLGQPIGHADLAFAGLLDSVRTGTPAYEKVTGRSFADRRTDVAFESAYHEQFAMRAKYAAHPIADSAGVRAVADRDPARIVVHSDAATVLAEAIVHAHPGVELTLAGLPSQAAYLRRDVDSAITDPAARKRIDVQERSLFEVGPSCDAVLFAVVVDRLPDADAAHALRRAAESLDPGGRILVFSLLLNDDGNASDIDEHEAEEDLRNLTVHGSGLRTDAEQREVFETAGLEVTSAEVIGWGFRLYSLVPRG